MVPTDPYFQLTQSARANHRCLPAALKICPCPSNYLANWERLPQKQNWLCAAQQTYSGYLGDHDLPKWPQFPKDRNPSHFYHSNFVKAFVNLQVLS